MTAMDLTTYSGLKAAIAKYLVRDDLTEEIPGFITLAEAVIRNRVRNRTIPNTITISSESTTLPTDCDELRSVRLLLPYKAPFTIGTLDQYAEHRASHPANGVPRFGARFGQTLVVSPVPQSSVQAAVRYFEKLVPLSDAQPNNSVLLDAPNVYLFGALCEAEPFLQNDERVALWQTKRDEAITALDSKRERDELSGATFTTARLPVVF